MTEEEFDKAAEVACQLHTALGNLFRQKLEEANLNAEQREHVAMDLQENFRFWSYYSYDQNHRILRRT
ncbi:MAG: hypothetical protein WBI92_11750 [Cloacibacterium sp.]|uniref:hypothetical protein n=1 Tax=Cloacibacterium sp. TaxID=1913682 RepID=UPI003C7118BA